MLQLTFTSIQRSTVTGDCQFSLNLVFSFHGYPKQNFHDQIGLSVKVMFVIIMIRNKVKDPSLISLFVGSGNTAGFFFPKYLIQNAFCPELDNFVVA